MAEGREVRLRKFVREMVRDYRERQQKNNERCLTYTPYNPKTIGNKIKGE